MLIAEGEHKCVKLSELLEIEEFLLAKAMSRNNSTLSVQLCLGGRLVKEVQKDADVLSTSYILDHRVVLKTELHLVHHHKGAFLLKYKMMDWS